MLNQPHSHKIRFQNNWLFFAVTCIIGWPTGSGPETRGQEVDFAKQIRPLLSKHCLACHGLDEAHREADLRLDNFEDATENVIIPGDPEESVMISRISSTDESEVMPPPEHGQLSPAEVDLFRRWVQEGANYDQHWAFRKPQAPPIPRTKFDEWAHNEIDRFIAAQLESKQLAPSEPADWHHLLRRAALDLTGLPPTEAQIQKILAQPGLETYESLVDEWLASPAFGEHWAAMWLDIARYADTIGYTEDHGRTIWPWRDWVIRSFNDNKPFDQFTIEQLAGDLLPNATDDQRLATAFHRNTVSNSEGGTIDEEFRVIAIKDRINTTINVWMGLTMRCAECHTHKYDPVSIEEYYQFYDYFNQTADADRPDEEPRLDVYTEDQRTQMKTLDAEIVELKRQRSAAKPIWTGLKPVSVHASSKSTWKIQADDSVGLDGAIPDQEDLSIVVSMPAGSHQGLQLEALPDPNQGNRVGLSEGGNFILSQILAELKLGDTELAPQQGTRSILFSDAAADYSQMDYDVKQILDDQSDELGWAVAGAPGGIASPRMAILDFAEPLILKEPAELTVQLRFRSKAWPKHIISRIRLSSTEVDQAADKSRRKELDPLAASLTALELRRKQVAEPIKVPVLQELSAEKHRQTRLMTRGSYLNPAQELSASVPTAFHPFPEQAPANRLGVAQWLVDPNNPLTARVTVNRFWARIFGRGIVETEEDFGTQGSIPTHPELLDWLALDFQKHDWNVKRLLKQLVLSSTYRQTNQASADRLQADPLNLYFARGPRGRLSAEVVRDQALMVSGLLSSKMFGPPVYPPSPIKKIRNSFAGDFVWTTSTGEDRYRRAIYTYLKRSQPHPLFETFDMATRQVCSFRRFNTNTPLQSFMTLNDEGFLECAQHLARQMAAHSDELPSQLRWGLETALRQPADTAQIETLQKLVEEIGSTYADDLPAARAISGVDQQPDPKDLTDQQIVELANLTVVANVILNLDAFLTK